MKVTEKVNVNLLLAFPEADKANAHAALTREDFEDKNLGKLLPKLGIPGKKTGCEPSHSVCEDYKRLVCRYVGPHSLVPCKTPSEAFIHGTNTLDLAESSTKSAIQSQVNPIESKDDCSKSDDYSQNGIIKEILAKDEFMNKIKQAKINGNFGKKFQEELKSSESKILLKELKPDSLHFLTNTTLKKHPIYGGEVVKEVISAVDDQVNHQGTKSICDHFKKKNIVTFDERGEFLDLEKLVEGKVAECTECITVGELKSSNKMEDGLTIIKEDDIEKVLIFADRKHLGFQSAYNNLKNWCTFADLKKRVKPKYSHDWCHLHIFIYLSRLQTIYLDASNAEAERHGSCSHPNKERLSVGKAL